MYYLLFILSGLSLLGCSLPGNASNENQSGLYYYEDGPTPEDRQKLWDAMVAVLGKDFVIRESVFREGVIVAVSPLNRHGSKKTRAKLTAKIIQDEEGYFQPMVRVVDEMDISEPRPLNPTGSQPAYEWIHLRNNPNLEAKLVNAINQAAYGSAGFSAHFFKGPVEESHPPTSRNLSQPQPIPQSHPTTEYPSQPYRPSHTNSSPRYSENVPIFEPDFGPIPDPKIDSESVNAEESSTLSPEKEKSIFSD